MSRGAVVASPAEWEVATTAPRDIAALEGLDLDGDDPTARRAAAPLRRAG